MIPTSMSSVDDGLFRLNGFLFAEAFDDAPSRAPAAAPLFRNERRDDFGMLFLLIKAFLF